MTIKSYLSIHNDTDNESKSRAILTLNPDWRVLDESEMSQSVVHNYRMQKRYNKDTEVWRVCSSTFLSGMPNLYNPVFFELAWNIAHWVYGHDLHDDLDDYFDDSQLMIDVAAHVIQRDLMDSILFLAYMSGLLS